MKRAMMALALAMSFWSSAAYPQSKPAFVFTAIPDQDETRLVERFTRVADYLQGKLGLPVKYLPVKSYPAAVTAFTNGQVQLAWFGGFTGVQARRQVAGSEAIAQGAEDVSVQVLLHRQHQDRPRAIQGIPERRLPARSFTFGSRASTSGRLMPEYFHPATHSAASPDEVFARVGFSGDHSRTIQLVQSGAYEVGVLDYSVWELDKKAGKIDPGAGDRDLGDRRPIPDYQWTVRGDVDSGAMAQASRTKLTAGAARDRRSGDPRVSSRARSSSPPRIPTTRRSRRSAR